MNQLNPAELMLLLPNESAAMQSRARDDTQRHATELIEDSLSGKYTYF